MYLGAAKFWGWHGIQPFSAFDDPNGYAGAPPSVQYLRGIFTDKIKAHRVFIDRDTATKPMTFAKTDHTFDVSEYTLLDLLILTNTSISKVLGV